MWMNPSRSCHWCTMGEKRMKDLTGGRMHGACCSSGFKEASYLPQKSLLDADSLREALCPQVSPAPRCEWGCDCERGASLRTNFIAAILKVTHNDHLQVCTLFQLSFRKRSNALMFKKNLISLILSVSERPRLTFGHILSRLSVILQTECQVCWPHRWMQVINAVQLQPPDADGLMVTVLKNL